VGEVVVITSGKGGVGKTTTVANLGVGLAAVAKKRVALVDTDIGLRNLDVVMGLENRIVYDLVDVAEGTCRLKQALIKDKRYDGLFLLPAAQTRDKNAVNPDQMRKICADLRSEFDFVLIDCPAGIEQGFRNAVAGAQKAMVVATPEVSSVRDADRVIGLMEAEELHDIRLIVNRVRVHMVKRGEMLDVGGIQEILSVPILGVVPEDEVIVVSTNRGEPAVMDGKAMASRAYKNITRRLIGEDVPLMPLDGEGNVFGRLRRFLGIGKA